jgi:hypothetical protein
VTQAQTIGSIASMTALNGALWLYRLPIRFTPGTALLAFALGWLARDARVSGGAAGLALAPDTRISTCVTWLMA